MIARKIREEEFKRVDELFSVSFESKYDNDKTPREVIEDVKANPDSREAIFWQERYAAFEDDDKTMMSSFIISPMLGNFDGNEVAVDGVGGVATLPQYRRRGGIRECMKVFLKDSFKAGHEFSYLYPFSTAYYRKFGYELGVEAYVYKINLSFIPNFDVKGHCVLSEPSDNHLDDIKALHSVWEKKYNMMIINRDYEYGFITESSPFKDIVYTYIYRNEAGTPKGYMRFNIDSDRVLNCQRIICVDAEGFKGLMNLAKSFASDHPAIRFVLPDDWYIRDFFPEWSLGAGEVSVALRGMGRVVCVKKVLEMAKYKGDGEIRIKVSDNIIEENNRIFKVTFKDGKAVNVSADALDYDIAMSISDFSRLITGCLETDRIDFLEKVDVKCDKSLLAKVFYKKPLMIMEYF